MGVYNSSGVNDDRKEYYVVSKKYLTFRSQHLVRITLPVLEGLYELLINIDAFQYNNKKKRCTYYRNHRLFSMVNTDTHLIKTYNQK